MAVEKEPPDSWRGSLSIMYPVGRGFIYESWRLIMYSYFITVHYKTYDIAAYLRGAREPGNFINLVYSYRNEYIFMLRINDYLILTLNLHY